MGRPKKTDYKNIINCEICGITFERHSPNRKLCSRVCYAKYRSKFIVGLKSPQWKGGICTLNINCLNCRNDFIGVHGRQFCSRKCHYSHNKLVGNKSKENNGMWKGGRTGGGGDYVRILIPNHPNSSKDGYVLEHRLVMEEKVGRYLNVGEVVHHINHIRDDNRIENLQLLTKIEHDSLHLKEYRDSGRNIKRKSVLLVK